MYINNIIIDKILDRNNFKFYLFDFNNCQFNNCNFHNVVFDHCIFRYCAFTSCRYNDVTFIDCSFFEDKRSASVNGIWESACYFEKNRFEYVRFENCYLHDSVFNHDSFNNTVLFEPKMSISLFYSCGLNACEIVNPILNDTVFFKTNYFDIKFTKVDTDEFTRFTLFHCSKQIHDRSYYRKLKRIGIKEHPLAEATVYRNRSLTYSKISKIYNESGNIDISAEYYYLAKKNEGRAQIGLINRGLFLLFDILCGYGERPSHTFICILLNILLFGLFYLFSGFSIGDRIINLSAVQAAFPQNIIEIFKLYCHSVFFSITTFSTVGYGNYVPVGAISSTLAAIQMLMGVSLTALWTGCIFRKISR